MIGALIYDQYTGRQILLIEWIETELRLSIICIELSSIHTKSLRLHFGEFKVTKEKQFLT